MQSDLDSNFASQETLVTIANDTGGKAFLDSNDFSKAYAKVQADSEKLLRARLPQLQPSARRPLPPHSGQAEPQR